MNRRHQPMKRRKRKTKARHPLLNRSKQKKQLLHRRKMIQRFN
ncbi:hypothetical protein [Geobacillus kaustophilus]|nr:hypothetical protein [Geobacillus kaustophilus]